MRSPTTEQERFLSKIKVPAVTRDCFDCDETFIGSSQVRMMIAIGDRKFCFRCAMKRQPRKVCLCCGTEFRVSPTRAEFCSQTCQEMGP